MMKNCDRGLENAARGRRPRAAFSRPEVSFSPYEPTQSRKITCIFFPCRKFVLQPITNGFVYATLSLNRVARLKEQIFFNLLYVSCIYVIC